MSYPGRKAGSGVWQQIISQIPMCDIFVEVMAGSGFLSSKLTGLAAAVVTNDYKVLGGIQENLHYISCVAKYDCTADKKVVFYFDPPYMFSSRKSQRPLYTFEWNDNDHVEFLTMVHTVKSNCMISHYPCSLYNEMLKDWRYISYTAPTHGGHVTEGLWMNYDHPKVLLIADHAGTDHTNRQGLKRKVNRLHNKIMALPAHEKAAIFTALKKEFGI